ncbi:putative NRPS-like protein biosynthetic cluster [Metarhizium acridum]|nr:putative NRPS-like protein biosynthetic cluster [Metarhizium acridum]
MTYRELDDLSTRLANGIICQGIRTGSIIVVLIEKSLWVPVAQIAVMKCGCASTVLDAGLPLQRHQSISKLVQPAAILTSPGYADHARELCLGSVQFILSYHSSQHWPAASPVTLPTVDPSAWLYIVFTSGSMGIPKGVVIAHANCIGAVLNQQERLDFREFDRVFDFASYAFDASWWNLIHSLTIRGCLCIPSDDERKGDLPRALREYQVNYAILTPSVAWFRASELPAILRTIHFGGEPRKVAVVKELSTRSTINAYGPAECPTVSTALVTNPGDCNDSTIGIGTGLGTCTWIVKLDGSG